MNEPKENVNIFRAKQLVKAPHSWGGLRRFTHKISYSTIFPFSESSVAEVSFKNYSSSSANSTGKSKNWNQTLGNSSAQFPTEKNHTYQNLIETTIIHDTIDQNYAKMLLTLHKNSKHNRAGRMLIIVFGELKLETTTNSNV